MAQLFTRKLTGIQFLRCILLPGITSALDTRAVDPDPFTGLETTPSKNAPPWSSADPFDDLTHPRSEASESTGMVASQEPGTAGKGRAAILDTSPFHLPGSFGGEGFTFKKEILLEISRSSDAAASPSAKADGLYSRHSVGFEMLKKFSSSTATLGAFDLQMRLVRRDNFHEVLNDAEGRNRLGWFAEYHNLYLDLYNVLNPLLSDAGRSANTGRFNLRVGRFYLPFGLNLQTDTHGTVLQLSNERNFGFERDWYAGLWGSINADLNYDCYYLLGSGYDASFKGQSGLIGTRLSLSSKYFNEYGIEGGLSFLSGQRISEHALERSPSLAMRAGSEGFIATRRYGGDVRWRHPIPTGSLSLTTELSTGDDQGEHVFTQLYGSDYLTLNRKFGLSGQYRRFKQDVQPAPGSTGAGMSGGHGGKTDASLVGEVSWYFRNDLGNANLHWVKLNLERALERQRGGNDTIISLQYYRYW